MNSIAQYSTIFVEGATTSVKAGAKLCYWSVLLTLISAIGMIISQNIENRFKGNCTFEKLGSFDDTCMTTFLDNNKKFIPFRIVLRLFDALASILLIAVGNCLENVFKNTIMARVMSGTLRLSCFMVIFEICFSSGLDLQQHDFAKLWTLNRERRGQVIATYFFMDSSSDMIWTLDNLLYMYFLLILGFLSSDHEKFSQGYSTTAFIGAICGFVSFIFSMFGSHRNAFVGFVIITCYLVLQLSSLIITIWTGKALSAMEGDLVGKRGKKGKKGKKHHHRKDNKV